MSKHAEIVGLLNAGMAKREIAEKVGCSLDYIRAVRNRERNRVEFGGCTSPVTAETLRRRYRFDPAFRDRTRERAKASRERQRARTAGAPSGL